MQVRLHKYIADCGIASRRKAEEMILHHEVTVNGKVITEMGYKITPGKDAIKVKGKLLKTGGEKVYIAFYKPPRVVTTLEDPEGRKSLKDFLPKMRERVFPVGRMDFESEGLLILTNDGEFTQSVIHPKKPLSKTYLVKLKGKPEERHLERLKLGVTLIDGRAKAISITQTKNGNQYDWYKVVIHEGKNRQVQRMFEKVGFDVLKVKRVAIGRLTLGHLERGDIKYLSLTEAEKALRSF